MNSQSVTIGLINDIFAKPLAYALEKKSIAHPFTLHYASLAENARKLSAGEVDIALVSPVDYGKNALDWELVPGLGIASYGVTGAAKLLFKKGLHAITTIATDMQFPTEMVVLQLAFLEKTGTKPQFIAHPVQPGIVPEHTDAVLLIGNDALPLKTIQETVFDVAEEWNDLTELPLVHAVYAARRENVSPTSAALLMQAHAHFVEHKETVIAAIAGETGIDAERLRMHLLEELRYTLDESDIEGIQELFRHCFYHKMIDEIPDLVFSQSATPDQSRMN
jgi:chorismate dehydratase